MSEISEKILSLQWHGVPVAICWISLKNVLEFFIKYQSPKRSWIRNLLLLLSLGFGSQLLAGVALGQPPKFMLSDKQALCYIFMSFLVYIAPSSLSRYIFKPVSATWILFKICGAIAAFRTLPPQSSHVGGFLYLLITLMGGLLFAIPFHQNDIQFAAEIQPSVTQALIMNSSIAVVILFMTHSVSEHYMVIALTLYHVLFPVFYAKIAPNSVAIAKRRKIKIK